MFLLLLALILPFTFAAQVPVCKTVRHTGLFNDTNLSTLYSFSLDLSVTTNNGNLTFSNTVTVTNFTEWYKNSSLFNRLSPWSFTFYNHLNKKVECPSMTENCVIQFPDGQQRYYFTFSYKNVSDQSYFANGPQVFVSDGIFFDGVYGNLWDPNNASCMNLNQGFANNDLVLWSQSCCKKFDYINIPDSNNEICNVFETNLKITVPSESVPLKVAAEYQASANDIFIRWIDFPSQIEQRFKWNDYMLNPTGGDQYQYNFPTNFQCELLFDYTSNRYQFNEIPLGKLIRHNGIFLKNQSTPFTPADPCWNKTSGVPFSNATYDTSFCCTSFTYVGPSTLSTQPTTASPIDPRSNAIGALCSNDTTKAWLDAIFIVDTSSTMTNSDLNGVAGQISGVMSSFTIGQYGNHTTRAAIISYTTNVTIIYQLNNTTNFGDLQNILFTLPNYLNSNDLGGNIKDALTQALNMTQNQASSRVPLIVLYAAAFNSDGGAIEVANRIKSDGIKIVVVNFRDGNQASTDALKNISSSGYYFSSSLHNIPLILSNALTQINCICPSSWTQFRYPYSQGSTNVTAYADCLYVHDSETYPFIANKACQPGILVALTSQQKLDFITDEIIPHVMPNKKNFTIGLHKTSNGTWKWWGYNGTEYPLGDYPQMLQPPNPNDNYGYMSRSHGFNWELKTTPGIKISMPYVCKRKACDADNFCIRTK